MLTALQTVDNQSCLLRQKPINLHFLPSNTMYFSNKDGCLYSNQPQSGKQGKDCRRGEKCDTKPLDPFLIESRGMATDWGSIVKTNKH